MPHYDFSNGFDEKFMRFHKDATKHKGFNAFVVAKWCGHCQQMEGDRRQVVSRASKMKNSRPTITLSAESFDHIVNHHPDNKYAQILQSGVNGYPSMFRADFTNKDNVEVNLYEGERVAKDIHTFFYN